MCIKYYNNIYDHNDLYNHNDVIYHKYLLDNKAFLYLSVDFNFENI